MRENVRLAVIVVGFVLAGAGLWWVSGLFAPEGEVVEEAVAGAVARDAGADAAPEMVELEWAELSPESELAEEKEDVAAKKKEEKARTGEGVITVLVVDREGRAVSGATVRLELIDWEAHEEPKEPTLQFEGYSGVDGALVFESLPDGSYAARAWTATAGQSGAGSLREGSRTAEIPLELWDGAPTSGYVTNLAGEPIAGAVVHVHESDVWPGMILTTTRAISARVHSDESGFFRFPNLTAGKWRLYARAEGYASAETAWFAAGRAEFEHRAGEGRGCVGHRNR